MLSDVISGEWGNEPKETSHIKVIRTTNFSNDGKLNLDKEVVIRDIDSQKVEKKRLKYGDIIIEKSGGSPTQPVGRVVYFDLHADNFLCNNFTAILRPKNDVCSKYLFYCFYQFHTRGKTISYQNKTTGIINLKLDTYLNGETINLPSFAEQQKIAAVLAEAESLILKRKQAIAKLDVLVESIFFDMFGDPATNPRKWEQKSLREVSIHFSDGPFGSNLKSEHYRPDGVRVIRLQNIGVGEFIDKDEAYVSEEHYKSIKKHTCYPGEILIGTIGSPNLRACILPNNIKFAVNKADCIRCKPNEEHVQSQYLCHLLNNSQFQNIVKGLIHGQTRSRISMGQLSKFDIPVPPLNIQNEFRDIAINIENQKNKMKNQLERLEENFQSLLQRAFSGQLELK
nr:restriction endonuclease subunit S [Paenibacillus anseongense]